MPPIFPIPICQLKRQQIRPLSVYTHPRTFGQDMDLIVYAHFSFLDDKYQVCILIYNVLVAHNNKKNADYLGHCFAQCRQFFPFSMPTNGVMVLEITAIIIILDLKMLQNYKLQYSHVREHLKACPSVSIICTTHF